MNVAGEFARTSAVFEKPTLKLLGRKWAPVVLSVFATHFTRERSRIPMERFHSLVEQSLDELAGRGEDVPEGAPRDLCRRWVNEKWLSLTSNEDNVEEYALTSHAQEALESINRMAGDRAMFGESRIKTILDAARACATMANPDRDVRLARLNEQITELSAERDRIEAGGKIEAATADQMLDAYQNLAELLSALPADFTRVSETFKDIHRTIVTDFRADDRRFGDVIDDYIVRSERLMEDSAEGRAFAGAVALLRDNRMLEELRNDVNGIIEHEFAVVLKPDEKQALRRTATTIWNGIEGVLEQRRRLSYTLRTHLARQDALRDRELDEALRVVQAELSTWMETSRPRSVVPIDMGLSPVNLDHLRERFHDPADDRPPPPLMTHPTEPDAVSYTDIRQQGGPSFADMLRLLADRFEAHESDADNEGAALLDAAELFDSLPDELRRPVEVLGLIDLHATGVDEPPHRRGAGASGDTPLPRAVAHPDDMAPLVAHLPDPEHTTLYETLRPDGTRQVFRAPKLVFTREHLLDVSVADSDEEPETLVPQRKKR